jgi:hypothetical protein
VNAQERRDAAKSVGSGRRREPDGVTRVGFGVHQCKPPMGGPRLLPGDRTDLAYGSQWRCPDCGATYQVSLDNWGRTWKRLWWRGLLNRMGRAS